MKIILPQFTGPFDLLLSLIGEKKLNVSEVALSAVTEQFLRYLDTLEERRAEELADFLVVAARLLLLKSQQLLPQFAGEEDEGASLEDQLRLYQQFVEASKSINRRWMSGQRSVFRVEPPRSRHGGIFTAPENATLETLHGSMVQLVHRLAPPKPLPEASIDRAVSMKEKVDVIRRMLSRAKRFSFREILSDARNKTEVIVSFLAILELLKQRAVFLRQKESFSDILIEAV